MEKRKVGRDIVGGVALLADDVFGVGEGCHAKNETISTDCVDTLVFRFSVLTHGRCYSYRSKSVECIYAHFENERT